MVGFLYFFRQGIIVPITFLLHKPCRNPSLGLATKARACKSVGQEGSPRITFHAPGSAKECERMNLHTPKGTPTLGVGDPVDAQIFRE